MTMPDVPAKLFTAFNDVTYFDEPHKYFIGKKELISVTTLIHKFQEEFDENFWSKKKGDQYNIQPHEIRHAWRYINKIGTEKGSIIHDYAENIFNNKKFPYKKDRIEKIFGYDPVWDMYLKTKNHVDTFYKYSQGRLVPIKTELVVCDKEYGIAGMVDLLFWNVKAQEFQIWDWKTNKDFEGWHPKGDVDEKGNEYTENTYTNDVEGRSNLLGPLGFLKDNDMEVYSIQLATYKHIIERNTGIKLGSSYLIWVSHLKDRFYTIKTLDRDLYVKKMIEAFV
jgi:hypothetical protein